LRAWSGSGDAGRGPQRLLRTGGGCRQQNDARRHECPPRPALVPRVHRRASHRATSWIASEPRRPKAESWALATPRAGVPHAATAYSPAP